MSDSGGGQWGPGDGGRWQAPAGPPPPGQPPPPPGSQPGRWQAPPPPGSQPGQWQAPAWQPQPTPSWQAAPPPYTAPRQPPGKPSGMAVTALVFGIASYVILPIVGGIVAIVLGTKARRAAKDAGTDSGVAQTGQVLGIVNVAVVGVIAVLIVVAIAARTGHTQYTALHAGDCFNPISSSSLFKGEVDKVDCLTPHEIEATGPFEAAGTTYPGVAGFHAQAATRCQMIAADYLNSAPADVRIVWFYPTAATWDQGIHTVLCGIENLDSSKHTGSFKS